MNYGYEINQPKARKIGGVYRKCKQNMLNGAFRYQLCTLYKERKSVTKICSDVDIINVLSTVIIWKK